MICFLTYDPRDGGQEEGMMSWARDSAIQFRLIISYFGETTFMEMLFF
jgi:hypothetical protein